MIKLLIILIELYQKYFSPDHSQRGKQKYPLGYCRFSPSCSEYAKQALKHFGLFKGSFLAIIRVLRCNPFSTPAYYPLINPHTKKQDFVLKPTIAEIVGVGVKKP